MVVALSLFGSAQLDRAKNYCSSSQKERIYKGLNEYKSIYIKALIDEDEALKRLALQGLIRCSKKLGLSTKEYEEELGAQNSTDKKPRLLHNRLQKIVLHKGFVEFVFAYPLQSKDITKRVLKSKRLYKYIYDIEATVTKPYRYRLRSVRAMRVAQFDKKHIRIVFENSRPITITHKIVGPKFFVYLKKETKKDSPQKSKGVVKTFKRSAKVIVIDPGHGGRDSGAIGYKRKREKDIVLAIAKRLYKKLKRAGYRVYLTRRGDYFVDLRSRTRFANRVKANLFISIHANAAPSRKKRYSMKGVETFFLSPARSERAKRIAALENRVDMKNMSYYSKNVFLNFINREKTIMSNKLAIDIQRNILFTLRKKYRGVVDGGVRPGPFWVLVGAQMPAILVEVGYITNPTEAKRLSSPYYQNLIAEGIKRGIESYFRNNEK